MADEDFDLELEEENKVEKRINRLSQKVKEASDERDSERKAREEAEKMAADAQKERDFYESYSDMAVQYPDAKEFKDSIKEKVISGYSVEDATLAVLAKAGKLGGIGVGAPPETPNPAGGSAPNMGGQRTTGDMSMSEMRDALIAAEQRGEFN